MQIRRALSKQLSHAAQRICMSQTSGAPQSDSGTGSFHIIAASGILCELQCPPSASIARTPACLTALSTISVTSCSAWQQAHSSYKMHNPVLFQIVTVIGQRYLGYNPRCFKGAHSSLFGMMLEVMSSQYVEATAT